MTNEPGFAYHLANVKHLQWKRTLARQAVPVPGTCAAARLKHPLLKPRAAARLKPPSTS